MMITSSVLSFWLGRAGREIQVSQDTALERIGIFIEQIEQSHREVEVLRAKIEHLLVEKQKGEKP